MKHLINKSNEQINFDQTQISIQVFCSFIALSLFCIYFSLSLISNKNQIEFLNFFLTLGFSFYLINVSWRRIEYLYFPIGSVIVAFLFSFSVYSNYSHFALLPIAITGALLSLVNLVNFLKNLSRFESILFLTSVCVTAFYISGVYFLDFNPLFKYSILFGFQYSHTDTLHFSGLVGILNNYGIFSTGLDGFEWFNYHYLVYVFETILVRVFFSNQIVVLNYICPIFLIPMFLKLFLNVTFSILNYFLKYTSFKEIVFKDVVLLLFLFVLMFVNAIPYNYTKEIVVPVMNIFLSDSFLFSNVWMFLLLLFVLKKGMSKLTLIDYSIIVSLWTFMSLSKISSSAVLLPVVLLYGIRKKLIKNVKFLIVFGIISLISLFCYKFTMQKGYPTSFIPFHFYKKHVSNHLFLHLTFFYFWIWTFLFLRLFVSQGFLKKYRDMRFVILLIALIGAIPGCLIDIGGGSALYFSLIQYWIAMLFSLVVIIFHFDKWKIAIMAHRFNWVFKVIAPVLIALVFNNAFYNFKSTLRKNFEIRLLILNDYVDSNKNNPNFKANEQLVNFVNGLEKFKSSGRLRGWDENGYYRFLIKNANIVLFKIEEALLENPRYSIINYLDELEIKNRNENHQHTALYIPKSNHLFWGLPFGKRCSAIPFVTASISGFAMINGLPPKSCQKVKYCGYETYDLNTREDDNVATWSDSKICSVAKEKKFENIIVVEEINNKIIDRKIKCI